MIQVTWLIDKSTFSITYNDKEEFVTTGIVIKTREGMLTYLESLKTILQLSVKSTWNDKLVS